MAIRSILTAPDPRLKTVCDPVPGVDDDLRALMDDMLDTMYDAPGIGLAAIQIGVPKRVLVLDVAREDEGRQPQYFVNPEIVWVSDDDISAEEGCLSVPEHYADVIRPAEVKVRALDYDGSAREVHADGLLAVCLQHEIDHLNGILFVDHLTALKRNMILRKLLKAKKQKISA
ncbi:peptide deformylase [Marinibaculum pumilum]|uniref:Peptide deformylase n=1 Tax=Marinibaculum pumilum TaxID=1766165 RepID=A0ABV7L676_9PROT